jgi:hypothetical protein
MEPLIGLLLEVLGEFLFRLGCLVFGSASFLVFFYAAYSAKKGLLFVRVRCCSLVELNLNALISRYPGVVEDE